MLSDDDSEHFIKVSSNAICKRKQQENFVEQINLRQLPMVDYKCETAGPCTCIDDGSLKESLIKSDQTDYMNPKEC